MLWAALGLAIATTLAAPPSLPAPTQPDGDWVGRRVVQKSNDFPLRADDPPALGGGLEVHVYRVQRVDADTRRLWLKAEGEGPVGWASPDQVIPVEQAIAFFTGRIRSNPEDIFSLAMRAALRRDQKEYDLALSDLDSVVRLDPRASSYVDRGIIWAEKREYDKAIADYTAAIRLNPNEPTPLYNRAIGLLMTHPEGAVDDAKAVLHLQGWRGNLSMYAVLMGHFAARRAGQGSQAKALLDEAAARCDTSAWPYPVVKYLRGEIDEAGLLAAAIDTDKMTVARCFLGLDALEKGRREVAEAHFRWVKEHGNPGFFAYAMSLAGLNRLQESEAEDDGP
jgi:tetratricopeptide (TPR) repeat protein